MEIDGEKHECFDIKGYEYLCDSGDKESGYYVTLVIKKSTSLSDFHSFAGHVEVPSFASKALISVTGDPAEPGPGTEVSMSLETSNEFSHARGAIATPVDQHLNTLEFEQFNNETSIW